MDDDGRGGEGVLGEGVHWEGHGGDGEGVHGEGDGGDGEGVHGEKLFPTRQWPS